MPRHSGIRAAALLLSLSALGSGAALAAPPSRGWCGSGSGPAHDAIWAHREQAQRVPPRASAAGRATTFQVGQVAVLQDEGDLALLRNDLDLVNLSLRFDPVDGGYRVTRGAEALLTDAGVPVALSDDDSREVPLPFAFPFHGRAFDRVFVNSDGNLTFGEGDSASTPRRVGRLVNGPPRIAPLLTDLDPSAGGSVSYQSLGDRFVVTWREVPNFETPLPNTLQAVLHADGRVHVVYGILNGNADEGASGLARGRGEGGLLAVDFKNANGEVAPGALAESFRPESAVDEVAVARKYYASFPDEVQQLVVFSNRRLTGSGTLAYEQGVKNEVAGIGDGIYDYSAAYGSAGRLESFVLMDNILKYPDDPAQIFLNGTDSLLSVLAHETGHRWLVRARIQDRGAASEALLGRQAAHWSFFTQSSASFLEGNEIQDLGGGQFKTAGASLRYGPLDQYLMGLRGPEEVPPFFYVADVPAQYGDPARDPEPNVTFTGVRRDLTVADIVAGSGERRPRAGEAPTVLRQGFVYVAVGGPPVESDVARVERVRAAFPAFYAAGTEGRGQVDPRVN